MKKVFLFVVVLLVSVLVCFANTEEIDVYAFLYWNAENHSARLDILQHMVEARLIGAGEFYAQALRQLVAQYGNIRDVTERYAAHEQARILAAFLGAEGYTHAADDLWRVVGFDEPLVRAEALMALGRIRAVEYLDHIIRVLEDINADGAPRDRLYSERVAFGAIISLEKFGNARNSRGYIPVFNASTGWYSQRITTQASRSLPFISRNPTSFMLQVIRGSGFSLEAKLAALETIEASEVENRDKSRVAVAALTQGWLTTPNDQPTLVESRVLAIKMIKKYGSDNEAIYPDLEKSYRQGSTTEEKLEAISALGSLKTDAAATMLSGFLGVQDSRRNVPLNSLNGRRQTGSITREEERVFVPAVISALGQTGRSAARAALETVRDADYWTNAVQNLARIALRELN